MGWGVFSIQKITLQILSVRQKVVEGRSKLESQEQSVWRPLALGTAIAGSSSTFVVFTTFAKFNHFIYLAFNIIVSKGEVPKNKLNNYCLPADIENLLQLFRPKTS